MKINLQAKNLELTDAIRDYVVERLTSLGKLLSREERREEAVITFEVAKNTNHHKAGAVFHADCKLRARGRDYFASADEEDLYAAIDAVKDSLYAEINKSKDRRQTLFHRGARSVKKMMKGLSKRNPFTSKYEREN